jgi:hypothetical protein
MSWIASTALITNISQGQTAQKVDQRQLAIEVLKDKDKPDKPSDNLAALITVLNQENQRQIANEAAAASMPIDKYLESSVSFDAYLSSLKTIPFDKLDAPDNLIAVLKAGLRFRAQREVRFISDHYFADSDAAHAIIKPQLQKMGIEQ